MKALICGSFAYDNIMVFPDHFKNHILPDKIHMLNVSFMVPEMRREYGGCAGNIAYNLKLLEGSGLPMGTVGKDFDSYASWMDEKEIERTHVQIIDEAFTGQAFITTDLDDNQITAFHPGAMSFAHHNKVSDAADITIGIISPDGRDGMLEHASQFHGQDIPFIFDPGQGMPMFSGEELNDFIVKASWVSVNDYEWQMMQDKTGLSPHEVAERVQALIITRGSEGSVVYTSNKQYTIPVAKVENIVDPTGCGDAFRAGLLYGLMNELDWDTTGRIASLMGAIKIEHHGTQKHKFDRESFNTRFEENFGYTI
jgi:adenosine kinase